MAGVIPDGAELIFLGDIRQSLLIGAKIRLYQNDHTPGNSDELSDYVECDFPGYAEITLNGWGQPYTNPSNQAQTDETIQTWTSTGTPSGGSQNIYGYYVFDDTGSNLLYAERNPSGPATITAAGQTYSVTPSFSFSTGVPP